jgi:hypothetical protein
MDHGLPPLPGQPHLWDQPNQPRPLPAPQQPIPGMNPVDYHSYFDYQNALAAQHAHDEHAAWSAAQVQVPQYPVRTPPYVAVEPRVSPVGITPTPRQGTPYTYSRGPIPWFEIISRGFLVGLWYWFFAEGLNGFAFWYNPVALVPLVCWVGYAAISMWEA